ncbi:MAG TPA: CvpA family protein, partial [Acidimicrobiia bacterium]|nr:CvpA family protein [Acidimicrobiia bacterium]
MIDFVLGAFLAGLAVRGWRRGLLRELLDLAGLVLGAALAFRLAGPVGDFLTDRFGLTSEWARLGAGAVLFVGVGVGLSIAARVLGRALVLPGLRLANGLGGAAVGALWGAVLLSVALTLAGAVPLEEVTEAVEESRVASLVSGPESPLTRLITQVGGTRMIAALGQLDQLIGRRRVVVEGDERVGLEPVSADLLVASEAAAEELFRMLNQARL